MDIICSAPSLFSRHARAVTDKMSDSEVDAGIDSVTEPSESENVSNDESSLRFIAMGA